MIRVTITGPPQAGRRAYRFEWQGSQFVGVSDFILRDACDQLLHIGVMDDTPVGLFVFDDSEEWLERTTVGQGAQGIVTRSYGEDQPINLPGMAPWRREVTSAPPAKPKAPRPPPRKPPKPKAAKRPAAPKPSKSKRLPRKRRLKGSGGRRAGGRGR